MTRTAKFLLAGLLLFASAHQSAKAGPIGYVITNTGELGTVDLASGAFLSIACVPAGCNAPAAGGGIGAGPGGAIYVYDSPSRNLYRVNPGNAAVNLIGNTGIAFSTFAGLGDGRLYGIDFSFDLFQVDPATGGATHISRLLDASPDGIISNSRAGDGTSLFFTYDAPPFAQLPHEPTLYRIDPNTGALQFVGLTGVERIGGSGYIGGVLYGFQFSVAPDGTGGFTLGSDSIYQFDTATGAARLIGPYDAKGLPIFGAVEVPEPATLLLSGLAALAFTALRRWKKR